MAVMHVVPVGSETTAAKSHGPSKTADPAVQAEDGTHNTSERTIYTFHSSHIPDVRLLLAAAASIFAVVRRQPFFQRNDGSHTHLCR